MRLLLTCAGINNPTIQDALADLLGKPIAQSNPLCIPTAGNESSHTPAGPWHFIREIDPGAKCVGVLELTALPSIDQERGLPWVQEADVLLVKGGNALYLGH
jgi:dipeptidase E